MIDNAEPSIVILGEEQASKCNPRWESVKNVLCIGKTSDGMLSYNGLVEKAPADDITLQVSGNEGLSLF